MYWRELKSKRAIHRWFERIVRASVDFLGVQCSAVAALALGGWQTVGTLASTDPIGKGLLVGFYTRTFVPVSLLFIVTNASFALYTKSRGYTLPYKMRRATVS